jgi:spermidine synthase
MSRTAPAFGMQASPMTKALIRLQAIIGLGSFAIVALLPLEEEVRTRGIASMDIWVKAALLIFLAALATVGFGFLLSKLENFFDTNSLAQAQFLDSIEQKNVNAAILFSAALSLFLELAIIRWQSSVFEFFAFYKNFSLLACFLGLGLGYALATRDRIPLVIVIPALAWEFGFMTLVRFGPQTPFRAIPFREQLTMGIGQAKLSGILVLYGLLTVVFLLTALAFMPVGQLCGRLMERRPKLTAYGFNLLGSLIGVLLMLLLSFLWTPPLVWFALCFIAILVFHLRKPSSLIIGFAAAMICAIILAWPVNPAWARIYSPYQLLEIGHAEDTGLTLIRAAGHYYQRIFDFSEGSSGERFSRVREYYELPYRAHPQLDNVAVVGAGTGNDVAAALRSGAKHVEAIEIDPAIVLVGESNHPEKPYRDPRVHVEVNDARSFLRRTNQKFDLIVYGLLDSHTLLSHGSSLRLDSYVYTVEGLREARSRLNPDGALSLAFTVLSDELGRKIYLMMQDVFDGRPPVSIATSYDSSVMFLESNDKNWVLPTNLLTEAGFENRTEFYANPSLHADASTDDWPFFYMPRRIYPVSYLAMVFQILFLSVAVTANFFEEKPRFSHLSFFFLGMGFMLVETKGITEMGLTFGNTWQVIGFVIAGILTMAFLGNCAVQWLNIKRTTAPYLFLLATVALGWFVARSGGFASTPVGRLETAIVLTCPLFFSGIVFSTLLSHKGMVSGIMAMNLLGAICGGLLEYNSMYFGFQSLYVVAAGCYFLAFASEFVYVKSAKEGTESAPA